MTTISLGTANSFAVLAGSTVTNIGFSIITGDVGVSPGTSITGFPPGIVNGTVHNNDGVASQAQTDLTAAYNAAASLACNFDLTGQDLGGLTLTPGVYCFTSSAQLTGILTLDAQNDPNAQFIFKIGSTLTTASNSSIVLINEAQACNIFFQVGSSATLGTNTQFIGNILALTSITATTGATVDGRLLAQNGAVTLDTNNITVSFCVCLHGSSLIQMKNGNKRLDQIKEGDEVLSGFNLDQYTQVKGVAQCWLSLLGVDHDAIIFEPGSLSPSGDKEPSHRLIIDPGHPMCTQVEYLENGYDALRPAGTFWEELKGDKLELDHGQVLTKKWTDVFVQNEPSVRYDLILEEPFNIYVANGMVVRAKGYKDHRYKQFV